MIKISSCIIVKNEMPHVVGLIQQLSQFSEEVIVTDTGSTDGLLNSEIQAQFAPNVKFTHFDWIYDFAAARNNNFSYATGDMIFWCDADDRLTDDLVSELIEFRYKNLDEVPDLIDIPYLYWCERPGTEFNRMRLFKRHLNLIWSDAIHEYLPYDINAPVQYFSDTAIIRHEYRKPHDDRNLQIYHNLDSNSHKFTSRDFYYYANELLNEKYYLPAYLMAQQCVLSEDGWEVDKFNAVNTCSLLTNWLNCDMVQKPYQLALNLWVRGLRRPDMATTIANHYKDKQDWDRAIFWYKAAIELGPQGEDTNFLYDDNCHGYESAFQCSICYYHKQDYHNAAIMTLKALEFRPGDGNAEYNLSIYRNQYHVEI